MSRRLRGQGDLRLRDRVLRLRDGGLEMLRVRRWPLRLAPRDVRVRPFFIRRFQNDFNFAGLLIHHRAARRACLSSVSFVVELPAPGCFLFLLLLVRSQLGRQFRVLDLGLPALFRARLAFAMPLHSLHIQLGHRRFNIGLAVRARGRRVIDTVLPPLRALYRRPDVQRRDDSLSRLYVRTRRLSLRAKDRGRDGSLDIGNRRGGFSLCDRRLCLCDVPRRPRHVDRRRGRMPRHLRGQAVLQLSDDGPRLLWNAYRSR